MGVQTGQGVLVEGQYLNQPLNRCARLMAIGHGGQVLVSGATEPLVRGSFPDGVGLIDLGSRCKSIAKQIADSVAAPVLITCSQARPEGPVLACSERSVRPHRQTRCPGSGSAGRITRGKQARKVA